MKASTTIGLVALGFIGVGAYSDYERRSCQTEQNPDQPGAACRSSTSGGGGHSSGSSSSSTSGSASSAHATAFGGFGAAGVMHASSGS